MSDDTPICSTLCHVYLHQLMALATTYVTHICSYNCMMITDTVVSECYFVPQASVSQGMSILLLTMFCSYIFELQIICL